MLSWKCRCRSDFSFAAVVLSRPIDLSKELGAGVRRLEEIEGIHDALFEDIVTYDIFTGTAL